MWDFLSHIFIVLRVKVDNIVRILIYAYLKPGLLSGVS